VRIRMYTRDCVLLVCARARLLVLCACTCACIRMRKKSVPEHEIVPEYVNCLVVSFVPVDISIHCLLRIFSCRLCSLRSSLFCPTKQAPRNADRNCKQKSHYNRGGHLDIEFVRVAVACPQTRQAGELCICGL